MRLTWLSPSCPVFFLLTLLWAVSGYAEEVPRETVDRLADIKVEQAELRHLNGIGKLPAPDYNSQSRALQQEASDLWRQQQPASKQEKEAALSTVTGLTRAKLSLLEPRWAKEREEFRQAGNRREKETATALEKDARAAAEFQRQRILLQRQLDKGTLDQDTFAAKDKEAVDAIGDLRKTFEAAGGAWAQRFDARLTHLTKAIAANPDPAPPRARVVAPAGAQETGRGGAPDFDGDVKRAAEVLVKYEENSWKVYKKEGNPSSYTAASAGYSRELSRLRARYQALNKLQPFETAYTRMAAPGIQALKLKYQPEAYRPPPSAVLPPAPAAGFFDGFSSLSWWAIALYVLAAWIILGFITNLLFPEKPPPPGKPITSGIHGTADWAAHEQSPTTHTNVSRGVTFGKSSLPELDPNAPGAPITSRPETHVLITATSGAGKGTRVIIPTLLRYSSSMIVIDPKGENAAVTARARKKLGQDIQILNPWGVMKDHYSKLGFQTATFNPLDVLDPDDPNVSTIARTLAATMCPITDGKDSFWQGSAAKLLAGIFLWLTDNPVEQKTLARVKEIVSLQKSDFRKVLAQMLACDSFQGDIRDAVGQAGDTSAADTYGGIMFNLQKYMDFVDGPIKTSTATSTISMDKLSDGSLTLYVVIPFDLMETHSAWLRLVISSAIRALIKSRESAAGKALHRCMFMIDEFGSIGHIPDIVSQLAQTRSYGLDFTLILQDLNQLKQHYGKAERTILGNCRYKYFCDVIDLESAKWLSEALGKKTVQTVSTSTSQGATQAGQTEGSSTSYGETGRALLTPDEIMHLGKDTAILLNPDTRPHYLHPVDYRQLTQAYSHLKNSHPHLYWQPPLAYDQNPAYSAPENPFANIHFPPGSVLKNFPPMNWEKPKKE